MVLLRQPHHIDDNIHFFAPHIRSSHEDYCAHGLDALFHAENNHFWFLSRKELILKVFEKYVPKAASILEIGAGTGSVAKFLQDNGYDLSVGEMHENGLRYARSYGVKSCYQFDLFDPPFHEHFDGVGMFDVLEHLEDDEGALESIAGMLVPKGKLVLTVPAFPWLWCRDDAVAGHKRRYTVKSLLTTVRSAGFRVLFVRYFFLSILPLILLRRLIKPDNSSPVTQEEHRRELHINSLLNTILYKISQAENRMLTILPSLPGGSIVMVAEKNSK